MSEQYCIKDDVRAEGVTAAHAIDSRLDTLIAGASELVRHLCGWRFGPHEETSKLDGTGHEALWLPEPVADVTAITITSPSTETVDIESVVIYPLHLTRTDDGVWPAGAKNVEVTGTWGRCELDGETRIVPLSVKRAVVLIVVDAAMNPRAHGTGRGRLLGERTDKYSYQLAQFGVSLSGVPEADLLLCPFMRPVRPLSV